MVELFKEKSRCCGCMACADICPQNAIAIKTDAEGFWYPVIRQALCVGCGRCKTVCPLLPGGQKEMPALYLAAQAREPALREISSSGAVFPVLAQKVLEAGGVVYGAAFDASMQVTHQRISRPDELSRLARTKYLQSSTAGIFCQVRQDLQDGRRVLFSGTPCQAEALRRFLGGGHPGLVLVDLVCYGVPSPGAWARYTAYLEKKHHGKLTGFHFRDKRNRDNGHTVSFLINEQEFAAEYGNDLFLALYFSGYILRPSCHACPFAGMERGTDITIGDFWQNGGAAPGMDDGMGTSLVMLRSQRGRALWERVRGQFRQAECTREQAMQPRLCSPTPPAPARQLFFALYRLLPFWVFGRMFGLKKKLWGVLHGRK